MINCLVFDSNKISELLIKSYLNKSHIKADYSFSDCVDYKDIIESIDILKPNFIILDFELYDKNLKSIILHIKSTTPSCKIIIVTNKIKKAYIKELYSMGIYKVFKRPFIDADFIDVLVH